MTRSYFEHQQAYSIATAGMTEQQLKEVRALATGSFLTHSEAARFVKNLHNPLTPPFLRLEAVVMYQRAGVPIPKGLK